jgi:hypothetical protein
VTLQFNPNIYREPEEDHSDRDFILQALSQLGSTAQNLGQNRMMRDKMAFDAENAGYDRRKSEIDILADQGPEALAYIQGPRKILKTPTPPLSILPSRKRQREDLELKKLQSEIDKNGRAYGGGANGGMKLPPGYRWTQEGMGMEPIPGGPADAKQQKAQAMEQNLLNGQLQNADLIMGKVGQALKKVSNWSAGMGSKLSGLPTTDARDLAADLETIKANLGFQQLQEMRRQSPTGGALGNVSERELTALQSSLTSLDQAQSPEQLRAHLNEILIHYTNWKNTVNGRMSAGGQMPGQPQAPTGGGLMWNGRPLKDTPANREWLRQQGGQQ